MSLVKTNAAQIGQSLTATNNFTMYQPASPDGTVRWGVGNSGSVTDIITLTSSGNVGIGTSNPSYKFNLYDSANATCLIQGDASTLVETSRFSTNSNGGYYMIRKGRGTVASPLAVASGDVAGEYLFGVYGGTNNRTVARIRATVDTYTSDTDISGYLSFYTSPAGSVSPAERMRIDSSGNVGIGTSSPGSRLQVNFTTSGNEVNFFRGYDTATGLEYSLRGEDSTGRRIYTYISADGSTPVKVLRQETGLTAFYTTNTERMRIDSSGNVGIGTSSIDTVKLQVTGASTRGTALFQHPGNNSFGTVVTLETTGGTDDPALSFKNYNGGSPVYYSISGTDNGSLAFNSGGGTGGFGTERMRIDSSGNLLVGTTSGGGERMRVVASSNSTYTLQVRSDSSGDVAQAPLFVSKYDNNSTTSQVFVRFAINQGGTANGQINANGASQAAFGSWSDARLKENIETLSPQLANICSLRPVEFDYIESEGGGHQIGFVAQEMQEVYPDAVGEREPDKMLTITGWSKTEARLVKAIQELKAELDATKAEVAALRKGA